MIAVFSSSSPQASVALISSQGALLRSERILAPRQATSQLLALLDRCLDGRPLTDVDLFLADVGPGSFVGVRVGVVVAKCLAWAHGRPTAAVRAPDLMPPGDVYIPNKRNEFFFFRDGEWQGLVEAPPAGFIGYGAAAIDPVYPDAERVRVDRLLPIRPEALVPDYVVPPSISSPKTPYGSLAP